jgi:hypothetical protein
MGEAFVAVALNESVYVWGGTQKQPDGRLLYLPRDVIFSLSRDSTWHHIPATGDVPPYTTLTSAVVVVDAIYIFGGSRGGPLDNNTNDLR